MRYLFIILLFCSIGFSANSQNIMTKDGKSLGPRESFTSSCNSDGKEKVMEIQGIKFNTEDYCACICDNLIPTLEFVEIETALKADKLTDLFLKKENLGIILKCLEGNYKVDDDYEFKSEDQTEISKKFAQTECVKGILATEDLNQEWTEEMANEYCECALSKLYSKGYTYKDLQEIENEDSESFNEIAVPCVTAVLANHPVETKSNSYVATDIVGNKTISEVELLDYLGQGFKLKISIHGISKYFLFDTGASDLIINQEFERELLIDGHIKKEDYVGTETYQMANNEKVKAQLVKLNNIKIGDFTVNNVITAVLKEGSLLCGKGFLDKFKKWELDQEKKILTLYK